MISAFYTAASGTKWQQTGVDVAANNIANVNTVGYKPQSVHFSDLVYDRIVAEQDLKVGSGVRVREVAKSFEQGPIMETGNPLDAAIVGEGFFAVRNSNGGVSFTRDGSFAVSQREGNMYLVTQRGEYVLNRNLQPVSVQVPANEAFIVPDTALNASVPDTNAVRVGIFKFSNPYALNLEGDNLFGQSEASGEPTVAEGALLRQKSLENSSVDLTRELTEIIRSQRAFQMSARVIQTADEMEQTANSLRN